MTNNMKTIKIAGVLLMAMLFTTPIWAQDGSDKQQLTVALSDPGKPYKLDIDLLSGSINIIGYEGKDIVIDAEMTGRKHHSETASNGMKRLSGGGNLDITAEEKNNKVTVSSETYSSPITLTIKVPQNGVTLKVSTTNNGNLSVTNVSGEMEVTNTNGGIRMSNVSGSVVANTVNGPVVVSFKSIDAKAAMAFTTLNGSVDITFPAGLKANVKLKTDQGEIYTDFDVITDPRKPVVTRTVEKGMYSLKMDDWVYGKIDGGGSEMMMKTTNGSIFIRKAK